MLKADINIATGIMYGILKHEEEKTQDWIECTIVQTQREREREKESK